MSVNIARFARKKSNLNVLVTSIIRKRSSLRSHIFYGLLQNSHVYYAPALKIKNHDNFIFDRSCYSFFNTIVAKLEKSFEWKIMGRMRVFDNGWVQTTICIFNNFITLWGDRRKTRKIRRRSRQFTSKLINEQWA